MKNKFNSSKFLNSLLKNDINFFSGVPDSCLSGLIDEIIQNKKSEHVLAPNEGSAVSVGIGFNLSTSKIPCVYFQNAGLGNATDPLTNLCSKYVYKIPMLILLGWRGRPGISDEPQHKMQGIALTKILKQYKIDFTDIRNLNDLRLKKIIDTIKKKKTIFAILVDKNFFPKKKKEITKSKIFFSKNEIFSIIFKNISEKTKLITSTGYNSREALNHNSKLIKKFYLVGGMGHTLAVSYGISLKDKKNKIICIDGDGSFFMHLGSFAMIKKKLNKNFKYILLDNGRHESVGNVKINFNLNIKDFAKNVGFSKYVLIDNKNKENIVLKYLEKYKGSAFIHIKTRVTKEDNLQRPKNLLNIKEEFLKNF